MSEPKRRGRNRLKRALAKIAPGLAHALGGPLAGAAAAEISKAIFGIENVDEDLLVDAVATPTVEQRVALRKAELEFRAALHAADIEALKLANEDRASARARQSAMGDWAPTVLGCAIILGFFIVLAAMVWKKLPAGAETEFSIMLGALATMTAAVVNYFFGSSAGSKEKTRMIIHQREIDAALSPPSEISVEK